MKESTRNKILNELKLTKPSNRFQISSKKYYELVDNQDIEFFQEALRINFTTSYFHLNHHSWFPSLIKESPTLLFALLDNVNLKYKINEYSNTYIHVISPDFLNDILQNLDNKFFTEEKIEKVSQFKTKKEETETFILENFFPLFSKQQLEHFISNNLLNIQDEPIDFYNNKFCNSPDLAYSCLNNKNINLSVFTKNFSDEQKQIFREDNNYQQILKNHLQTNAPVKKCMFEKININDEVFNIILNSNFYHSDGFDNFSSSIPKNSKFLSKNFIIDTLNNYNLPLKGFSETKLENKTSQSNYQYHINNIITAFVKQAISQEASLTKEKEFILFTLEKIPQVFEFYPEKIREDFFYNLNLSKTISLFNFNLIHENYINNKEIILNCLTNEQKKHPNKEIPEYQFEKNSSEIQEIIQKYPVIEDTIEQIKILHSKEELEKQLYNINYDKQIENLLSVMLANKDYDLEQDSNSDSFIIKTKNENYPFNYKNLNLKEFIKTISILSVSLPNKDKTHSKKMKI